MTDRQGKEQADTDYGGGMGWRRFYLVAALVVLSIPQVAMRFSDAVRWDAQDFAAIAVLLLAAFVAIEVLVRVTSSVRSRTAGIVLVVLVALAAWAELAVGILD